ncbi:TPA: T9SS type A sorting domain-containing protein [Candidatus Poribacteria bacterium]|nr:T9SS type A sorting domain-containing protein [Candidatus Poribacteria bacterium]
MGKGRIKNYPYQNYPNPFNSETWIPYQLASDSSVTIRIYNTKGQLIRTIDLGHKTAGVYKSKEKAAYWNGRNDAGEAVASGMYFYTLQIGDFRANRRMLIIK